MNISNKALVYMTLLVLLGMGILFYLNLSNILGGQTEPQPYLKHYAIRGIAVKRSNLLYTLNFDQQNQLADILNLSVLIQTVTTEQKKQTPAISEIIVYQFNGQPDLSLVPIGYADKNLIYSMPSWNPNGYLMDVSEGKLQNLLSQTYDH